MYTRGCASRVRPSASEGRRGIFTRRERRRVISATTLAAAGFLSPANATRFYVYRLADLIKEYI